MVEALLLAFYKHFRTFGLLPPNGAVPFYSLSCKHPTEISCAQRVTADGLWDQVGLPLPAWGPRLLIPFTLADIPLQIRIMPKKESDNWGRRN